MSTRTQWWCAAEGRTSAFVLALTAGLLVLTGLVLDGGLALAAKVRATGQAESAARAGAQAIDLAGYRTDGALRLLPAQAVADAQAHLAAQGATGTATATEKVVTVTVTASRSTQLLWLVGITSLPVQSRASAGPTTG
ncbi:MULTISPECIES: pilus assembly protein TadG-related protein [Actinosynnema]|uniref:pilus assembly protein TadG-related protein n=1 Tax=Actinosynnema TaxID=40566 RepID=UPI0020A28134|nr:pilus assembly protein TadG-related protein [Actinosynnema pretiosum]MCP2098072.1 putative Flp pilus-assembly TadE/G-like [Actinosynnema pretiosum]